MRETNRPINLMFRHFSFSLSIFTCVMSFMKMSVIHCFIPLVKASSAIIMMIQRKIQKMPFLGFTVAQYFSVQDLYQLEYIDFLHLKLSDVILILLVLL